MKLVAIVIGTMLMTCVVLMQDGLLYTTSAKDFIVAALVHIVDVDN